MNWVFNITLILYVLGYVLPLISGQHLVRFSLSLSLFGNGC